MERWAKTLNKQKESFKTSVQTVGAPRDEEKKEAADACFSIFEKKVGASQKPRVMGRSILLLLPVCIVTRF